MDIELAVLHSQCWCRVSLRAESKLDLSTRQPAWCGLRSYMSRLRQPNIIVTSLDLKFAR
jgi:hypothetical protein